MKYVVADDHPSTMWMVSELLHKQMGVPHEAIASAEDSDSLLELLNQGLDPPAIVILDLVMPGEFKRLPLLRAVLGRDPGLGVVVYSGADSPHLAEAVLDAGAFCYVCKGSSASVLLRAISSAIQRKQFMDPKMQIERNRRHPWRKLTPREASVIIMLCKGGSVPDVANALGVTQKTVSSHKMNALKKLRLPESAGLTSYLIDNGLTYLMDE